MSKLIYNIFNTSTLAEIHGYITNAAILSWVNYPPANLGKKSYGKLKANHWLVFFIVIFSLILPEIWLRTKTQHNIALLKNLQNVTIYTYIIISYITSSELAKTFANYYYDYWASFTKLFPNVQSCPNHYYVSHILDLLQFWSSLIKLSEFPYKCHNGLLQKIITNNYLCKVSCPFQFLLFNN